MEFKVGDKVKHRTQDRTGIGTITDKDTEELTGEAVYGIQWNGDRIFSDGLCWDKAHELRPLTKLEKALA